MKLNGGHIIASSFVEARGTFFSAVDPVGNSALEPHFHDASPAEIDGAVSSATQAFDIYRGLPLEKRAGLLDAVAGELNAIAEELITRANVETALPVQRLEGELQRTINQLKLFAACVRQGEFLHKRIERADPQRKPQPKPDIRTMHHPLGPVAVFGASNFPLAFSVAGGDTASALAAGCPVVVKGHPAHPGTSELAGMAISKAVLASEAPPGVFSLLQGAGDSVGACLVQHPDIKAVAFTGSLAGGRAIFDLACARPEPVPVYAEMGSINPVFVLPSAIQRKHEILAEELASSLTLGVGQFCTAPGLIVVQQSAEAERFVAALAEKLDALPAGTMLHRGIKKNFIAGVNRLDSLEGVEQVNAAVNEQKGCGVYPVLLKVAVEKFLTSKELTDEVFGPVATVVVCSSQADMISAAEKLPGQLTATVQGDEADLLGNRTLLNVLERKAGRLVINGFPTGVEVCHAMHHGGPYPATTDSKSTSVGTDAMMRFLRPVCYQNVPQSLLPGPLKD